MEQKIVIAGGNGFIGKYLAEYFAKRNYSIIILSRNPKKSQPGINQVFWDGLNPGPWTTLLENAKAVINLSGKSVDCRYTPANKEAILNSRILSTRAIGQAIAECTKPPEVWINAASATIYRHTTEESPNDEINGQPGEGFSVRVCRQWEDEFFKTDTPQTRRIALRSAITLGRDGGALVPMRWLTRLTLGGRQGDGQQFVSWIHIEDLARIIEWIIEEENIEGVINGAAPYPVRNIDFMKTLRKVTGHVIGIPAPAWILEIGAFFIRTETELLLKSRKVVSSRLPAEGFEFKFPKLERALLDLTRGWS
ncbi:MAG: TIGR01777 family oxidoreductase [Saprospiraceae bacterium]|nr:TIGR01777 family oxidoreductase [Saprospiraceae bacterium]MCB9322481.1 TIGR01777 family protein [Lewinellaceae bacterium]